MKISPKLIIIAVLLIGIVGAGYYFVLLPQLNRNTPVSMVPDQFFGWKYPVVKFPITGPGEIAYSSIRDPGGIPQGLPVRLKIPAISVNSAIEDALITPDGRMDVPAGSLDVAWFALGPHPGQVGSAVIGGHFGINNGVKFVFYDLDKLTVGDKVYVEDDRGNTLAFQVRSIKLFDRDADATTVFTSQDGLAHLNLITCEGVWNQVNGTYPQRRVVFTDAISPEGAAPAPIPAPTVAAAVRTLSIGSRGVDVIVLQTALVEKGFLKMPAGVAKGYFGILTRAAVAKYQTSVGLASTGVFGASTRAKLYAQVAVEPVLPSAGVTSPSVTLTPTPQTLTQSIKSVYATPLDGIITSLLLLAIAFVSFKIILR
jgi:LPXTG-site transpeptidase (sortase) family protein